MVPLAVLLNPPFAFALPVLMNNVRPRVNAQVRHWSSGRSRRGQLQKERTGNKFWMAIVILAMVVAMAETSLGNQWSR